MKNSLKKLNFTALIAMLALTGLSISGSLHAKNEKRGRVKEIKEKIRSLKKELYGDKNTTENNAKGGIFGAAKENKDKNATHKVPSANLHSFLTSLRMLKLGDSFSEANTKIAQIKELRRELMELRDNIETIRKKDEDAASRLEELMSAKKELSTALRDGALDLSTFVLNKGEDNEGTFQAGKEYTASQIRAMMKHGRENTFYNGDHLNLVKEVLEINQASTDSISYNQVFNALKEIKKNIKEIKKEHLRRFQNNDDNEEEDDPDLQAVNTLE